LIEMTNTDEQEQKRPLTLARAGGRLELRKNVETGQVRQSFSHGRSKTVTVEVRKKRTIGPATEPGRAEAAPAVAREQTTLRPATEEPVRRPVAVPRALTAEEKAGRVRAVHDARKADEEVRRRAALAEADRRRQQEEQAVQEARRRAEEEARRKAEEDEGRRRAS
jgi:translation initiation factor IF-2